MTRQELAKRAKALCKQYWADWLCIFVTACVVHPVMEWLGWQDNFGNYLFAWITIFVVASTLLAIVKILFEKIRHDTTGTDTTD